MEFTKENITVVSSEIETILNDYAKISGITIDIGPIKWTKDSFKIAVTGADAELPGDTILEKEFLRYCSDYDLGKDDLHKVFKDEKDNVFSIVGLKKANRKYPIIAENVDTKKQYKFAPSVVSRLLNEAEASTEAETEE